MPARIKYALSMADSRNPNGHPAAGVELTWLPELLVGRPVIEREDFMAALVLNAGFDADAISPQLQALLERFAIRAEIQPGSPASVERQIAEYFALHPLAPDLVEAFERQFRSDLLAQDPEAFKAAVVRLGGHVAGWTPDEPPPEDSHPGGALGFFAARAKFDGK